MFTLTKLAYHSCSRGQRHWYDTVPRHVARVHLRYCCDRLLAGGGGGGGAAGARDRGDCEVCTVAAENGHMDCLSYAHRTGYPWDEETCTYAAEGGHADCLEYARRNGCPWYRDEGYDGDGGGDDGGYDGDGGGDDGGYDGDDGGERPPGADPARRRPVSGERGEKSSRAVKFKVPKFVKNIFA